MRIKQVQAEANINDKRTLEIPKGLYYSRTFYRRAKWLTTCGDTCSLESETLENLLKREINFDLCRVFRLYFWRPTERYRKQRCRAGVQGNQFMGQASVGLGVTDSRTQMFALRVHWEKASVVFRGKPYRRRLRTNRK